MRVLALVTDAFGGVGGIAQYNRDLLTAWAASAMDTQIVVLPRHAPEEPGPAPGGINQRRPGQNRFSYALKALLVAAKQTPLDLIFCGHLYMAPLAVLIGRLMRVPVWLQLHGIEVWERPGRLQQWASEKVELVTAVSRYTRRRFLGWSAVEPWRVRVLPNTMDERFAPGPKPQHLLERLGIKGKKVLLTVSRLSAQERYKGHDRVIIALPRLLGHCPELVYVIAGEGDDRPRLERLARDTGVAERVIFTGRVPDAELPDLYRAADVFVMPSTGEGFGIVFLEAAASGVSVVGSNCDGSMDALADGALGGTVDPEDPEALTAAIRQALSDNGKRAISVARFSQANFAKQAARMVAPFR